MKNKLQSIKKVVLGGALALGLPFFALAQLTSACGETGTIQFIICKIATILNTIIPLLIVIGVIYFIWGVISYVIGGDEEAKTKGRDRMIFGLIGLLVIVSVWGLVAILKKTFGITNSSSIQVPCISNTVNGEGVVCP
ncbi:MAG: hypothetical protein KBD52_02600 [Candidatus Pacebacteria bacterium]|nr:hypothetical protein [Candidatus Paceibacterota bacterium]